MPRRVANRFNSAFLLSADSIVSLNNYDNNDVDRGEMELVLEAAMESETYYK